MRFKPSSKGFSLFVLSQVLLLGAIFEVGLTLWKGGLLDINKVSEMLVANDTFKKISHFDHSRIEKLVLQSSAKDAAKIIDRNMSDISKIENIFLDDESKSLKKDMELYRKETARLISLTDRRKVLNVLESKYQSFNTFVKRNNWKTLTRVSGRILVKVKAVISRNDPSSEILQNLTNSLERDNKLMTVVTTGSVLQDSDKQMIVARIEKFPIEIEMLKKNIKYVQQFRTAHQRFITNFSTWVREVSPLLALKKIEYNNMSKYLFYSLIGFGSFVFTSVIIGIAVFLVSRKKDTKNAEKFALSAVKEGIIPEVNKFANVGSVSFSEKMSDYRDYVHKRISYGALFQDAMPFSSLLLDSNLNLIWANTLFYKNWKLEEYKNRRDSISWDFLQRFTNLGEDDPVMMALKEKVAGIYQINVKVSQTEDGQPFEMYVSPVKYGDETRIMLFFYPLRSVQDTIFNQTRAIVGTVRKTIEAIGEKKFDKDFIERMTNEYDVAGIVDILSGFESLNEKLKIEFYGLFQEISRLENVVGDEYGVFDELLDRVDEESTLQAEGLARFRKAKGAIIEIIELRNKFERTLRDAVEINRSSTKHCGDVTTASVDLNNSLEVVMKTFSGISNLRDSYKDERAKLVDVKSHVTRSLDQLMLFERSGADSERLSVLIKKIKMEFKNFDIQMNAADKVSRDLDIAISKISLMIEDSDSVDVEYFSRESESILKLFNNSIRDINGLEESGKDCDKQLIGSLKNVYETFLNERNVISEMGRVLESERDNRIEFSREEFVQDNA